VQLLGYYVVLFLGYCVEHSLGFSAGHAPGPGDTPLVNLFYMLFQRVSPGTPIVGDTAPFNAETTQACWPASPSWRPSHRCCPPSVWTHRHAGDLVRVAMQRAQFAAGFHMLRVRWRTQHCCWRPHWPSPLSEIDGEELTANYRTGVVSHRLQAAHAHIRGSPWQETSADRAESGDRSDQQAPVNIDNQQQHAPQ
jgi:hypothetical protein